jgi:hypothetical protein
MGLPNKAAGRNYKAEYKYQGTPEQIKRRSSRNKARRAMIKAGKAKVGDGKDINHKNGNPLDNRKSNFQVEDRSANRSYPRKSNGSKKNRSD